MSETVLATEWLPLTPAQLDFWEEFTLHPGQPFSTVAHVTELCGAVDEMALCRAITLTLAETQAFALRFNAGNGERPPQQRYDPSWAPALNRIDLQEQPDPYQSAMRLIQADIAQPRDLRNQPLAAMWLIKLEPSRFIWFVRAHHIVIDGFGMALVEHRCAALYAHFLSHHAIGQALGAFDAFQHHELAYVASERCTKDRLFWQRYLPSSQTLPTVRKGGREYGVKYLSTSTALPDEISQRLRWLSERSGIGWPDLLLTLSAAWLFFTLPPLPHDRGDTRTMWMPVMNRRSSKATNTPALAVNTLPFLVSLGVEETLGHFLSSMAQTLRELRSHAGYRLRQIAADRGVTPASRLFISPFINVQPFDPAGFSGCNSTRKVLAGGSGDGANLTFRGRTDADDLHLDIDIYVQQFPDIGVADFGNALQGFLLRALREEALETRVGELVAVPA
ncbi:condensation domain-containing protein [Serratia grimesii]|uniref:condensation domain-containing protein n=1 Tax=Serratia grimesii TaxID=82995 RepID=UPI00077CC149|nr:condensation domain-containing protein [Serratia grimesii]CAI0834716.1 Dimodular nonribosomal peptide synthase [Serratia grimesii]CAI2474161.1 Dimodular nonribosomal peptide synthase [Serratia grimesii]SUI31656.1 Dimodular nonribosomal peptide synthase [Serratia grimesii]